MHAWTRTVASALLLLLAIQFGGEARRCLEGLEGRPAQAMPGHETHHEGDCPMPASHGDPGCPEQPGACLVVSHCAVLSVLPVLPTGAAAVATPAERPAGPADAILPSFTSHPAPPPPRA